MSSTANRENARTGQEARPQRLVVVAFDGVSLGELSFACGVFSMAIEHGAAPGMELQVVSGEPASAVRSSGIACDLRYDLDMIRAADLVLIAYWRDPEQNPPQALLEAIRDAHAAGARIAGLCSGAFVLAAAGLLDDRPATTHWALAPTLGRMYPKIHLDPKALYIDDGDVLTSGGGAAAMDLGLHVLRGLYGATVASSLARFMVVPPHRRGGQAQYIESPVPEPDLADPVGEAMSWALQHLDQVLPIRELASRAQMSRRNFDRRFAEITGTAPAAWLTHQRVLRAQQLLESTDMTVEEIARRSGFPSAAALRAHFGRAAGVAPAEYRRTFAAPESA
jgi:transcriptional regulator GlxA family with amidase domain